MFVAKGKDKLWIVCLDYLYPVLANKGVSRCFVMLSWVFLLPLAFFLFGEQFSFSFLFQLWMCLCFIQSFWTACPGDMSDGGVCV